MLLLYKTWKNTERRGTQIHYVDDLIEAQVDIGRDALDEITQQINEIKAALIQQYHDSPKKIDPTLVRRYKQLGDAWSEVAANTRTFRVLTPDGRIFVESIVSLHSSVFPSDF